MDDTQFQIKLWKYYLVLTFWLQGMSRIPQLPDLVIGTKRRHIFPIDRNFKN